MKKTLFLSAILATALCSSAFGASTTITGAPAKLDLTTSAYSGYDSIIFNTSGGYFADGTKTFTQNIQIGNGESAQTGMFISDGYGNQVTFTGTLTGSGTIKKTGAGTNLRVAFTGDATGYTGNIEMQPKSDVHYFTLRFGGDNVAAATTTETKGIAGTGSVTFGNAASTLVYQYKAATNPVYITNEIKKGNSGTSKVQFLGGASYMLMKNAAIDELTLGQGVTIGVGSAATLTLKTIHISADESRTQKANDTGYFVVSQKVFTDSSSVDVSGVTWKLNGQSYAGLTYDSATKTISGNIATDNYYLNDGSAAFDLTGINHLFVGNTSLSLNTANIGSFRGTLDVAGQGSVSFADSTTLSGLTLAANSSLVIAQNTQVNLANNSSVVANGDISLNITKGSTLDLSGGAANGATIASLLLGAQGEGKLKLKTGTTSWCSVANNAVLTMDTEIIGNGLEIDSGSLTISAGKTLNITGKMQFENGGTLKVAGSLNSTYVGLGHGARSKGNLLVSGDGIVKTDHFEKVGERQFNTITLEDGGSLQITGSELAALSATQIKNKVQLHSDDFVVTVTDGKLIAAGNDWTLNHAATIGKVQVLGANKVTMSDAVTFKDGAFVNVGSATGVGHLSITGSTSGTASFVVNAGSDLTISAESMTMTALTLGRDANITAETISESHNGTLTTTTLTVGGNSTLNANLVVSDGGTMDFSSSSVLTMGCTVSIGAEDGTVTVVLNAAEIEAIQGGQQLVLIDGVDGGSLEEAITIKGTFHFRDAAGNSLDGLGLALQGVESSTEHGAYAVVVTPEPATATLSLLALAALAARRKRH